MQTRSKDSGVTSISSNAFVGAVPAIGLPPPNSPRIAGMARWHSCRSPPKGASQSVSNAATGRSR